MEKNTFATSAYIASGEEETFRYLCELRNLDEWTLGSRMLKQVDSNTWLGTASGYQRNLYYHVRALENLPFKGIEWHCGFEYQQYFHIYPAFLFSPEYIEPGTSEKGVYFHWLSFIGPSRRTTMIMEGIDLVHTSECRSLKGILERNAGHDRAVRGQYRIESSTIYIDAPLEQCAEYLGDLRNMREWAHLTRPQGEVSPQSGTFVDEYGQTVEMRIRGHRLPHYFLLEQDAFYPKFGFLQRTPALLIPCSYAFGEPSARGCILHRISFWRRDEPPRHGKLQVEDFGAENMGIKRKLEARAGNLESFARGLSYLGPTPGSASEGHGR